MDSDFKSAHCSCSTIVCFWFDSYKANLPNKMHGLVYARKLGQNNLVTQVWKIHTPWVVHLNGSNPDADSTRSTGEIFHWPRCCFLRKEGTYADGRSLPVSIGSVFPEAAVQLQHFKCRSALREGQKGRVKVFSYVDILSFSVLGL